MTGTPAGPLVTHLPLVVRRGTEGLVLAGHVARANGHWRSMDGATPALAIFLGPHGYVSPTWYVSRPEVPTWNYATVHVHGRPRAIDDAVFTGEVLAELARAHERGAEPFRVEDLPPDFSLPLLGAIVGLQMQVERLEAKFKMGQTLPPDDRAGAIAGLRREATPDAAALAAFMEAHPPPGLG